MQKINYDLRNTSFVNLIKIIRIVIICYLFKKYIVYVYNKKGPHNSHIITPGAPFFKETK